MDLDIDVRMIAQSERDAWLGRVSEKPYVLAVQPTLFDPSRAPEGRHTLWAYCHVPNGSPASSRLDHMLDEACCGDAGLRLQHEAFMAVYDGSDLREPPVRRRLRSTLQRIDGLLKGAIG